MDFTRPRSTSRIRNRCTKAKRRRSSSLWSDHVGCRPQWGSMARPSGPIRFAAGSLAMFAAMTQRRFPPPWSADEDGRLLHRPRRQRAGADLRLFRGGAGKTGGGEATHARRGAAHRGRDANGHATQRAWRLDFSRGRWHHRVCIKSRGWSALANLPNRARWFPQGDAAKSATKRSREKPALQWRAF
jgi:hypothetical protein